MNTLRKVTTAVVVEVPVVKAPVRKLRPWVKQVAVGLALSITLSVGINIATTSDSELASKVTWVDAYAHDGDGYERMVRRANGSKDLDIKSMSTIMQDKNNHVDIKAGTVYHIPVLEAK